MKRIFALINKNLEGALLRHQKKNGRNKLPIITISREKGSGGRPIAYLVAKKLKSPWKVYHRDIVEEMAHETSLDKETIEQFDEHQSSLVKELMSAIFGKQSLSLNAYYKHLLHILATIGTRGHAIIVGRGANFLFPNAFKVRIVSSMEDRIQSMIRYEHVSANEAKKRIEKSDAERNTFTKELFQHDTRKAHHYDLIIRTGKDISVEDAADMIVALAKRKFK